MQTKLEFNNKCTSCGAARRKEDLVYSKDDIKPYCANINVCNADHPNSYTNVLTRGGVIEDMINFKEAQTKFTERIMAQATPEQKQVIKMMQSPTTLRIEEYDLAQHLIDYKEKHKIQTITETFREIVREHMESYQTDEPRPLPFTTPILEPVTQLEPPIMHQPEQITTETMKPEVDDIETF